MEVINEVKCREKDGEEIKGLNYPILKIKSHWNNNCLVVLEFDKIKVSVKENELLKAIKNATDNNFYS